MFKCKLSKSSVYGKFNAAVTFTKKEVVVAVEALIVQVITALKYVFAVKVGVMYVVVVAPVPFVTLAQVVPLADDCHWHVNPLD